MRFDFLYNSRLKYFTFLRRTETDNIINVFRFSCKVSVIIRFSSKLNVLDKFSESTQISNFIKIGPMGAKLFHADGQRDRHDEANGSFTQFSEKRLNSVLRT